MDKNTAIAAALVVIALAAAWYLYQRYGTGLPAPSGQSYAPPSPLEAKPDLNPVSKTNPFSDVRTNPFE